MRSSWAGSRPGRDDGRPSLRPDPREPEWARCTLGRFAADLPPVGGGGAAFAAAEVHRSTSPNTMSIEPMLAETSASMCPRVRKSIACKCANPGARILHLYGLLPPLATR